MSWNFLRFRVGFQSRQPITGLEYKLQVGRSARTAAHQKFFASGNGARADAKEFLRRYEAVPDSTKAELIRGIFYMAVPVTAEHHGLPDNICKTSLGLYCSMTPGVEAAANSTMRLGRGDVPQPDIVM